MVDIAAELPLEVIAELIGVPHEDRLKIFEWSNRMIGSEDPEYAVTDEEAFNAQVEMFMYAQQLAEEHRQKPSDDIITALLSAEIDGESLSDMDFNLFFMLLSVAGQRDHPQRHRPRHERVPREPRPVGPARRPTSTATSRAPPRRSSAGRRRSCTSAATPRRTSQLREHTIKAGDKISLWYISANRDEDVWDDPFTFDITRDPNPHIAFGGGGPHFCLGAQLARMEIHVLFEELVRRVDRVEGLGAPDRLRSNFIGGIKHLPVRFHTS